MASTSNNDRWYFTKEQLENTPSRKFGFDAYKELQYRQQAANFIQDMGQRLQVSQLCINTAIVYMHRFYVFHSFTNFPWHQIATAALFLAAKVEEQPRKLEYVIRAANICKNPRDRSFDINSERYAAQSQDLVFNENVLLQTLGFDVAIDHPHTYVVKCCHLVRASKDLAQTSYFMASNSLHLTTMCIQYKPTVVACFCILLACKWSNWEIPLSNERKEWYTYVDPTVTAELLQQLTNEFLVIFENCPSRLKEKIGPKPEISSSPLDPDKKDGNLRALDYKGDDHQKHRSSRPGDAIASSHRTQEQREREYKERKEKERIAHMSGITLQHQSHHHRPDRPPSDPAKMKQHSRPHSSGVPPYPSSNRNEPRDILREATKDSPFGIPTVRDHTKDVYAARSDNKEVPKRESLPNKSSSQTDPNSLTNYSEVRQLLKDPSRSRMSELPKLAQKHEAMRRYEEQKQPPESIKKPHSGTGFDKAAYHKSSSSTSHKVKSPFNLETKSVPKPSIAPPKPQFNGNANGSYESKPPTSHEATDIIIKTEPHPIKEEIPTPAVIKRPSLFSPDQTPQHHPPIQIKTEIKTETIDKILSPITSPPSVPSQRNRNYSSSSEPELRPTMKKIDQVEGFENLMRDSTIGVGGLPSATDALPDLTQQQTEMLSPIKDSAPLVNGLETNPTLISNLLKEVATKSHLPGVAGVAAKQEAIEPPQENQVQVQPPTQPEKEHRHHKSKKKKDKHKHKEKSKEEKEKKKKHKDKDREKHKHKERKEENVAAQPTASEPIKIKIQMGTVQPVNELKIKIPKDKIKTEGIIAEPPAVQQQSSGGLKIKIPKEKITNSGGNFSSLEMFVGGSSSGRKRDRDKYSPAEMPPAKVSKSGHKESKQNGRHSYNKVSEPTLPSSFASTDQIDSSVSNVNIRTGNVHSSNDGIQSINNVQQQFEENNNKRLVNDLIKPCSPMKPSPSKYVSSTVDIFSPGLLSPISPNDTLETFNPPQKISPLAVSPVSSQSVSINKQFFGDSAAPDLTKSATATPATTSTPATVFHPAYSVSHYDAYGFSNVSSYQKPFTQNRQNSRNSRKNNQRQPPPMYPQQSHSMAMPVQMDYNQMAAYNAYQMPPPSMPNVSMPPPNYGMYTGPYYGTYYDMYQSQMAAYSGTVAQPPLPTDAPPVHEAPPPPPPE